MLGESSFNLFDNASGAIETNSSQGVYIKNYILCLVVLLLCLCCISCSQSEESKEKQAEKAFKKYAGSAIEELREKALSDKLRLVSHKKDTDGVFQKYSAADRNILSENMMWASLYFEYDDTYKYNIVKTSSITSPYIATLTLTPKTFYRKGKTRAEVLKAEWVEKLPPKSHVESAAYQNKEWVYVKSP